MAPSGGLGDTSGMPGGRGEAEGLKEMVRMAAGFIAGRGALSLALILILAASLFAASESVTFTALGFKAVSVSTSLTASIAPPSGGSICKGSSLTVSGGNTLSGTASAIYGKHTCYVRNLQTGQLVKTAGCPTGISSGDSAYDQWPATFDPVRCIGSASVTNLNPPGYSIGSSFSQSASPQATTTYSNDARATTCSFVAHVQSARVRRNDACCDLVVQYANDPNYLTGGGGSDAGYTTTSPGDYTFTGTPSSLSVSAATTVNVADPETLDLAVSGISSPPASVKSGDVISYSFTIKNPTSYPLTITCTNPSGTGISVDGQIQCPLSSLAAGASYTVTGRVKVNAACGTNGVSLGSAGVSYSISGSACIDRTSGSKSAALGSTNVQACANVCPTKPTITCSPASPLTIPTPGASVSTTCTASGSTDADNGPSPITYKWTSPESRTGASQVFTFSSSGTKTITAYASDGDAACAGKNTASVSIVVNPPPNRPPVADFTAPSKVCINTFNTFTDTSTDPDPGDTVTAWSWNFGDGTSGSTQTVSKKYTTTGRYTISHSARDNRNLWSSAVTKEVNVLPSTDPACFVNRPPVVSMKYPLLCVNREAQFNDTSTDPDAGQTITAWRWAWGDGTAGSTEQKPKHTYTSRGLRTITLTVWDSFSPAGSATAMFDVHAHTPDTNPECNRPPVANPGGPYKGAWASTPTTVRFNGSRSYDPDGQALTYKWEVYNGTTVIATLSGVSPTYTVPPPIPDTFIVRLTVTDTGGMSNFNETTLFVAHAQCDVGVWIGSWLVPATGEEDPVWLITGKPVQVQGYYNPRPPDPTAQASVLCGDGGTPPVQLVSCSSGICGPFTCTYSTTGAKDVHLSIPQWMPDVPAATAECDAYFTVEQGAACSTSATQIARTLTTTESESSTITVTYQKFSSEPPLPTISCGNEGALTESPSCVSSYDSATMLYNGTCTAKCTYGPLPAGTYSEVVGSTLGATACSDSALTVKVGPNCHDFI